MADPAYPEEEQQPEVEDENTKYLRTYSKVFEWKPPANEYELTANSFNVALAWEALLTLPTCQELLIKESSQKRFNLEVGVNVTQEFPWKQMPFRELRDLFDEVQNGQLLYNAFQGYDLNNHILLGYVPIITQDLEDPPAGDPFILFISPAENANVSDTNVTILNNIPGEIFTYKSVDSVTNQNDVVNYPVEF